MTKRRVRLKKELRLLDVYAIATGATLSAGFFLLPGIAAAEAGPALVLAYMLAAIPLIPAMFSVIELATAMPRAGGVYYFLDRALGPFVGTIGGIGTWLALILKVAFALVGMGAYISLFVPKLPIVPIAVALAVLLSIVNLVGAKKGGRLQVFLVFGLLSILTVFLTSGAVEFQTAHFQNFFAAGFDSIIATAGLVYISYVGVTKVASLSEEVKDPERNLPKGVILALATAILVYFFGTLTIVGLVPMDELQGNLTPVATAAEYALGRYGVILLSLAALLAFVSVANAGMMSASRYPLAMSRDHLVPQVFRRLGRFGTPFYSILLTLTTVVLILVLFDPMGIAKLASSFQLLMFALVCFAVIVMRESQITSYDPGYKSPFYPWMQIAGITSPFYLIFEMGAMPIVFSLGLIVASSLWYFFYARHRVARTGAIYHVFERLGRQRHHDLDTELRGILREKGLRNEDPFNEIVTRSLVFDLDGEASFEGVIKVVANKLKSRVHMSVDEIMMQIMQGTKLGATPVTHGVALPHFRTDRIDQAEMVIVRARQGVCLQTYNSLTLEEEEEVRVQAIFFLASPENNPTQHLRLLARIAERVDEDSFVFEWDKAQNEQELRESLLHGDHFITLSLQAYSSSGVMINKPLRKVGIPNGCLVAMLARKGRSFVPNGNTVLEEGDQLTVIGEELGLAELKRIYLESK
ncbi:MAG: amino acid permease [Desulfuromonadales bacterium]|nr:amino acid permease [Desulfuromonadales bacterium]